LGDIGFIRNFPGYYDGRMQEGWVRFLRRMRCTCCALWKDLPERFRQLYWISGRTSRNISEDLPGV